MKIAVCVQVDLQLEQPEADLQPVEAALQLREQAGAGEIVAVSIGAEAAADGLRHALAMGADRAVHCQVEGEGVDVLTAVRWLTPALAREDADLIVFGEVSARTGRVSLEAAVAQSLGERPVISRLMDVSVEGGHVSGGRLVEGGYERLRAALPAVVSVSQAIGEPRYPTLAGIAAAKAKPFAVVQPGELPPASTFTRGSQTAFALAPPRLITDDGHAANEILAFLLERDLL